MKDVSDSGLMLCVIRWRGKSCVKAKKKSEPFLPNDIEFGNKHSAAATHLFWPDIQKQPSITTRHEILMAAKVL